MSMRNLPTIITSTRFILAGIVAWLICYDSNFFTLISVILFVAGSLSDALDGAIARRQENPSKFGAFLDPIADKFLVFLVLISLVFNRDSNALFIISVVIISREILIMSLREWMATSEKGKLVEVSSLGKVKTIIQMSGISLVVGAPLVKDSTLAIWTYFHEFSLSVLLIGAIIGVYSAFKYLKERYSYLY
ncbi:MAG: CDP-alcohol phosphatidyltransferase family protein [Chloroflexota bacterium]|nr:CDP-alcohol phosphatidyltransferase family protein [Chloroflexota bacterium]